MKWDSVPVDEQETIINIDYFDKTISVYTTKQSIANRLKKRLGEPDNIDKTNGNISGVNYVRKLSDNNVRKMLSMSVLIGGFRKDKEK